MRTAFLLSPVTAVGCVSSGGASSAGAAVEQPLGAFSVQRQMPSACWYCHWQLPCQAALFPGHPEVGSTRKSNLDVSRESKPEMCWSRHAGF